MTLFAQGVCEICGMSGHHPDCEARARKSTYEYLVADAGMLREHSLFGARGICSPESLISLAMAESRLSAYLERALTFDPFRLIEAEAWWFIPEGWIGMIGFIVEKRSGKVFPFGSGLAALYNGPMPGGDWAAIDCYLSGQLAAVE